MSRDLCLWEFGHRHRTVLASVPPLSTPLGQSSGLVLYASQPCAMCPLMCSGRLRVTCRVLKPQNTGEDMPGPTSGSLKSQVKAGAWAVHVVSRPGGSV